MITLSTRPLETPPIVRESLTHKTIPAMNVEVPRVTMNESIPNNTMSPPLTSPMNAPAASATRIASATFQP